MIWSACITKWMIRGFLCLPHTEVCPPLSYWNEWPTPYFLLLLLTDLSLVPDSEVMLEVRGGGEERRKNLCCCFTFKKRPPDRFQLTTTPLQFTLLNLEATSRHFQMHVDTGYIPIPSPRDWKEILEGFCCLFPRVVVSGKPSNHFFKKKKPHTQSENSYRSWRKQQTAPCQQRLLCALCSTALRIGSALSPASLHQLCVWAWPGKKKGTKEKKNHLRCKFLFMGRQQIHDSLDRERPDRCRPRLKSQFLVVYTSSVAICALLLTSRGSALCWSQQRTGDTGEKAHIWRRAGPPCPSSTTGQCNPEVPAEWQVDFLVGGLQHYFRMLFGLYGCVFNSVNKLTHRVIIVICLLAYFLDRK